MSPLLIFVAVLVLIMGGAVFALRAEIKRAGGIKMWLADLPTTNVRIAVSILLAVFFVVISMLVTVLSVMNPAEVQKLPDDVLDTVALFLLGMMGIDAAAYIAKRITHRGAGGDVPPGSTATQPIPEGAQRVTVATQGGPSQTTVTTQQGPPAEGQ